VAPYDSSSFGASPPATRWTKSATRAASGPAVTYTFSNDISHASNHFIFSMIALPGNNSCTVYSFGFNFVLFIMKATPARPVGSSGSSDVMMSRFLLKHSRICHVLLWSRWVSCIARTAILFS
jgi:hypothetical protein